MKHEENIYRQYATFLLASIRTKQQILQRGASNDHQIIISSTYVDKDRGKNAIASTMECSINHYQALPLPKKTFS
jgi:hypothetical protein